MLVPHLINLILAQTRPDGGPLMRMGMTELSLPSVGASTFVALEATPASGLYGLLLFRMTFGDEVLTDTFSLDLRHEGARIFTGVLTEEDLNGSIDFLFVLLGARPLQVNLTNNDAVARQAFRGRLHYLIIDNPRAWADLKQIIALATGGRPNATA